MFWAAALPCTKTILGFAFTFERARLSVLLLLAILLIGLIVTWTGFISKVRWAWFVMFVIVWGWALPNLVYPDVVYPISRHLLSITDLPAIFPEGAAWPLQVFHAILHEAL